MPRWELEDETDGDLRMLPFPVGVIKFLHVLQVLLGLTLVIIHVFCAFTSITLWFLLGGIPGILYMISGLIGLFLAPADGKHRTNHRILMGLCVLFWVWALVFPLAYYAAYVYFLSAYDDGDDDENGYPIIELCVAFYLIALVEGFISMGVFAFSSAAASRPNKSSFSIVTDL